jgi:glycerol-3-phosphate dehydrogenase
MVSAGEVRAAANAPIPARTLDALKRRLWVTAGPCQGSLCVASLTALLAQECDLDPSQVRKHVVGSEVLVE